MKRTPDIIIEETLPKQPKNLGHPKFEEGETVVGLTTWEHLVCGEYCTVTEEGRHLVCVDNNYILCDFVWHPPKDF